MVVTLFDTPFFPFGIQMAQKWDRKIVLTLNARNEHDRSKFVEDLKESVAEMDEMETLRLESELEKQRLSMADNRSDFFLC
jgi:IQ motif/SEC7 domain-containing protein